MTTCTIILQGFSFFERDYETFSLCSTAAHEVFICYLFREGSYTTFILHLLLCIYLIGSSL